MEGKRIHVWVQPFKDREALQLQWIDPASGKRKTKSAGTADPDKAEEARADLEADLNHGRHREASRLSWEKFREMFEEEHVAARRENTRAGYKATLDAFEEVCHPTSLRGITERTISTFTARYRASGIRGTEVKASTVKVRLQFLRTALLWAVGQKLLAECPRFEKVKPPKKRPQPVPVELVERLLAAADGPLMRTFLLCGWLAGMRRNEALGLEWEPTGRSPYVALDQQRIIFPAEFVKGNEDQWVPLDPELRRALESLPRDCERVFTFTDTQGRPSKPDTISHRVAELAAKAGVRLTFRSLRRGFGCRYAPKVPAQVLQKLMRHSSIAITMTYYANVDDAVEEAVLGKPEGRRGPDCNTGRNTRRNGRGDAGKSADAKSSAESPSDQSGDREPFGKAAL